MQQQDNIKFENISVKEGLSQSVVQCIIQDHIGFMWFGTQDGLNKYDGKKFTVFRNDPSNPLSICNNYIWCFFEDKDRNLWIGTNNGLSKYEAEKDIFKNYKFDLNDEKFLLNNQIKSICGDDAGNLWLGTFGGGIQKYDKDEDNFHQYKSVENDKNSLKEDRVNSVISDKCGNILVGTWGGGLNFFDTANQKFITLSLSDDTSLSNRINRINNLSTDRNDNLYISTNYGLFIRQKGKTDFKHFLNDQDNLNSISDNLVSLVAEDSSGNIWVGTRENGLNLFHPETCEFSCYRKQKDNPSSLSNNSIFSIFEDRSAIVWVGTFGGGVDKFNKHSKKIFHFFSEHHKENSLSSNLVYNFCEDSAGFLWIGTIDNGLNKFDRKKNTFTHYKLDPNNPDSLSDNNINFIVQGEDDIFWLATNSGLNKFDNTTNKFTTYLPDQNSENSISHDTVYCLAMGNNGILWIGTAGGGLNKFDTKKEKFTHYKNDPDNIYSISSNRLTSIFIESDDTIWIGTLDSGIDKFDTKEEKFYHYKNDPGDVKSISGNYILPILKDKSGNLWAGTVGDGLNKLDRNEKTFRRYSLKDGLPNDTVLGILEDENGILWISTLNGLAKFNPETEIFKNYDARDGFQSNEYNQWSYLKLKSGELVFGGINGFNIFHPEDIKDNSFIPPVVISNFLIFNKPVAISEYGSILRKPITMLDEIMLTYRESVFSFEFASLDYNIPGKNQYAYKMEGFDKEWVHSGNRGFATYTNLNPDEYVFRVKGSNSDGVWNEEVTELKIKITPPFWKTLWFKGLSALAIAGAAGSVYKNKLDKITKEKKVQEEFSRKLIDVQENDRKRISGEMHDSIGQDLMITKNKLLLSLSKTEDKEFVTNNVKEATDILSDTIKGVREIIYALHPFQLERLGLSKAIESIVTKVSSSAEIVFTSNVDNIDKLLPPEVEISLYRIIQECISNIVKHSQAKEAMLNINKGSNEISIMISDDGQGFNLEKVKANSGKYGFGLFGMTERVKLFNGKLDIKSSAGEGTVFNIRVPYKQLSQ